MTNRERFLRTMRYESVDHPPLSIGGPWAETRVRWEAEGLPKGVDLCEYFGVEPFRVLNVSPETRIFPPFEPREIERTDEYVIKINSRGVKVRMTTAMEQSGPEHYLEYPIKGSADKAWLAPRLDPLHPGRDANGWPEKLRQRADQPDALFLVDFGSFYGDLHEHMGTAAMSLILYDEPDFVHWYSDRIATLCEHAIRKTLPSGAVDLMGGHEDMCFKNGPLVSPAFWREFLAPYYRRTVGLAREMGQWLFWMDCDGDIRSLVPLWLEVGVNLFAPCEVAAGVDVREIRKEFGREARMLGGIDKRALAAGPDAIRREVLPKLAIARDGGYVPDIDHGIPPDVPFAHYRYYVELLKSEFGL
jgi:uroporphyrinogen decarboxylase